MASIHRFPLVPLLVLFLLGGTLVAGAARADASSTRISLPRGPGSIEGLGSADFTPSLASGTASYSVPIAVPPAAGAFGPSLSLSYDSGGGITEIGIGWRLAGQPRIRRRLEEGLPAFDDTDTFELVGLGIPCELVEVSPGVFRPRYEDGSFVRVERSAQGDRWEARTKSGVTYRFGGPGHTESEGPRTSAYLLDEQRDRHGHRIAYEWDASEGHALLTRVVWNDFDEGARNEVTFTYETRPDPHRGFSTGILEALTRRLKSVSVLHGGALVRRLDLTYGGGLHPALGAVTLFGRDGVTALPPARFDYTESTFADSPAHIVTMQNTPGISPASADTAITDLDGDGLPDFLVGTAGHYRSYRNHDGKRWLAVDDWTDRDSPSVSLSATGVQLADLDADGAPDLVVKSGADKLRYFPHPTGTRFDAPVSMRTVPSFTFEDPDVRLADLDGDRRTDVIVTTVAGIAIGYDRSGSDFTEPSLVGKVDANQTLRFSDGHTELCDVNGDRVLDFCYLRSNGLLYWLGRGRGRFEPAAEATGVPAFDASSPFRLDDLNGDGWVDLVRVDVDRVSYVLATAEGAFGNVQTIEGIPKKSPSTAVRFADMNGSGTVDIVWVDVVGDENATWKYLELFPSGRAGLLRRIDNGLGKVQTIDYEPAALAASRAREAGAPWTARMNIAMPVVRRVTVDTSLGDPSEVVEYTYRDGTYDPRERTFAGFGGGTERALGDASTPGLVTETTFDTGLDARCLRGAPRMREVRTESGSVFTRITTSYTAKQLAGEPGARSLEYAYRSAELVEHIEGGSSASTRRTLTEFVEDEWGNTLEERRWGEIRGSDYLAGQDEALVTRTFTNDPTEWLLGVPVTEELTDAAGMRVTARRKYYDGQPFQGLPLGSATRGDLVREEAWVGPAEDAFELVLGTRYDDDGQPLETKDARGGGRVFEWAADHTALRAERVKLDDGRELIETAETDGAFGTLLAVTAYNGQQTRYEYDAFGRLTKVIKPGDTPALPTSAYSYAPGAPLSRVVTDARVEAGKKTVEHSETLYDGAGRARGTLTRDGDRCVVAGVSLFDARGNARRTLLPRWAGDGGCSPSLLDGSPRGTDVFHDATGREIRTHSPSGIEARTEYFPLETRHWDGGQNDAGAPFEHTPTVTRVDGLGRTVAHVQTLQGSELTASYTYDAAGNLLSRTDPEGAVASYRYDGRGRRVAVDDPDLGRHAFTFDATSNLVAHAYPDGKTARFTFDLAGRSLTEDHDGDGTPEVTRTWDVAADRAGDPLALGKLTRITGPSGETRHEYDERGRTTKTTLVIDGTTYTVGSVFDDQDRERVHVYPDGSSIELRRNPRGQLSGYGHALDIDYGEDGLETGRRFNTGVHITSNYDDDRRRTDLRVESAGGAVVEDLHWTYDSGGNLVRAEDRRPGVAPADDRSETYVYDNLYRLAGVQGAWGKETYRYSASGSLRARASSVKDQTIATVAYAERPHAPAAFDDREVHYDGRARMTADGTRDYTWNDADELAAVKTADGGEENTYDGDGTRRIRVEHGPAGRSTTHFIDEWSDVKDGELVRYIVHGGQRVVRLAKTNGSGAAAFSPMPDRSRRGETLHGEWFALLFVPWLAAVGAWLARRSRRVGVLAAFALVVFGLAACAGEKPFAGQSPDAEATVHGSVDTLTDADTLLTTDLLGSLLGEATGSGNATGRFSTYPFGRSRHDGSTELRKYAGAPRDAVGLDAMGARYFAPDLGVWTSGDPLAVMAPERLVTEDFAAANPYAYAKDSPLLAADRDGHFWHIAIGAAVGGLVGGAAEAGRQYLTTGKVEDWGRVAAAAGGGAVAGALTAANPVAGLGSAMAVGAATNTAEGVTKRLILSGGHSAGTFHEAVVDAAIGAVKGGLMHGGAALAKTMIAKAPSAARAVASKVSSLAERIGRCPCFAAGTPVATPDGERPIEALRPGDPVLTRNELTGETTIRPIARIFVTPDKEVLDLTLNDATGTAETIHTTPGHPFWQEGEGWTEARDLALGAPLQTAEHRLATLSAALSHEARATVYNLEVAETHTYFVGETKAWVHNACGCGGTVGDRLPESALVCRGGMCTADRWSGGTGVTLDGAGRLQGASVNSSAEATLEGLTASIRNRQVGVATVGQVRALGGEVAPSPSLANPVHATLSGITPQQAQQLFTPTVPNPSL